MKVQTQHEPEENKFKPCSITLTMESQKEFDAIYFIFNYPPMVDALREYVNLDSTEIREELRLFGENTHESYARMKQSIQGE